MSFKTIQGQSRAIGLLRRALDRDKVHHAYLFIGPDGIGKKKTALEMAKALNCFQPGPEGGCDSCASCLKMEKNCHPDLVHLKPEKTQITIDQIRELEEQLAYPPFGGRYRLILLDKASDFNVWAANAFLKTLEEPPAGNIFVLLVNDPGELLPTLVSRCLPLHFSPLPPDLISRMLITDRGSDPEKAQVISRVSGGSLGRAFHLFEKFSEEKSWDKNLESWLRRLESLPQGRLSPLIDGVKDWLGSREQMQEALEIGSTCLRDLLWLRNGLEDFVFLPAKHKERLKALAFRCPESTWLRGYDLITQTAQDLLRQVNPQLTWEMLWVNLARAAR
jgi:DNA polymerase III subunit delta'